MSARAAANNQLLTGNLGVMRDYLNAREQCRAIYQEISSIEHELSRPGIRKIIKEEAAELAGKEIILSDIKALEVARSMQRFAAKYFKEHEEEIKLLKTIRTVKSERLLDEIFNVEQEQE